MVAAGINPKSNTPRRETIIFPNQQDLFTVVTKRFGLAAKDILVAERRS
jgi:hypothetical protein